MKELVVISGKGGTGKTSVLASFASLASDCVVADCDVDAADLHLILAPTINRREKFSGGSKARIKPGNCTACGKCEEICQFGAIYYDGQGNGMVEKTFRVDPVACEGCGVCFRFCAEKAIEFAPAINGEWFVSDTRFGPLVHARLGIGESNSGKLVSLVRKQARQLAEAKGWNLLLVDGPPGVGCPVIASVTGCSLVLVVTEPTLSGEHDLERVLALTRHFGIETAVCVNKWDLNEEMTEQIEGKARQSNARVVGRIRYDQGVTKAQVEAKTVVEADAHCADDIRAIWNNLRLQVV